MSASEANVQNPSSTYGNEENKRGRHPGLSLGSKHNSGGDETPPIPEEELEAQKIEHECQVQKAAERQAREAEEDAQLDLELLHQRAIEAEEEHKREMAAAVGVAATEGSHGGMNTSWSHHELQRLPATRWRHSRPSIPDASHYARNALSKASSTQLGHPESMRSILCESDGIFMNLSRLAFSDEHADCRVGWRETGSEVNLRPRVPYELPKAPSLPGCRAPIASLDCMDEFSANSQQMLDQMARHVSTYMGNHTTMPSVVTPGLRYKNLGKSGLRVPNVALGLWSIYGPHVPEDTSEDMINYAIDSGINMFDLSEAHSAKAETEFGRTLKKRGTKRASIIITTKVYWSTKSDERGLSRKHIVESVKASLARLQVEYIDVVLLHKVDPVCPMEEMVRTMNFIINQGWAMYWGTARWSPNEIMEAYTNCRQFNCITPIVEQTEYHMFCREKAELHLPDLYHKIGVGMMVWSAITTGKGMGSEDFSSLFAKSRFNRKYSTFSWFEEEIVTTEARSIVGSKEAVAAEEPRSYAEKLRDLSNLAANLNCSLSQMAIAWCLKNEMVNCVLLGASNVGQLKENIDALQVVPQLSATVMTEIEQVLANKPVRPPMVSTLAMRTQMQAAAAAALATTNSLHVDLAGATTSGAGSPKPECAGEAIALEAGDASTPGKEPGRAACEVQ